MLEKQLEQLPSYLLRRIARDIKVILLERENFGEFLKAGKPKRPKRTQTSQINQRLAIQKNNEEAARYNASDFLVPRHFRAKNWGAYVHYLPHLCAQNWSHLFACSSYSKEKRFYVYAHVDPSKKHFCTIDELGGRWGGTPFYIGKGTGNRAWDLKRNQGHGREIEKMLKLGHQDKIVKIVAENLTEQQAFELESKLIYFFGTVYCFNKGPLLNLDIPATPKFVGEMRQLNINVPAKDKEVTQ